MAEFPHNSKVSHKQLGTGIVLATLPDNGGIVVRFGNKIENCPESSLTLILDPFEELALGKSSPTIHAVCHFQALAIKSVNDKWGVFNCSKIDLLPHQLWVCREARKRKPCRLMVADDVGLGKTIEAGIIVSSYLADNPHARILILTPAALTYQWCERLKDMFDKATDVYVSEADTPRIDYWGTKARVVASYNTLSLDNKGRIQRLLDADPWDLVIVDEAHHLNYDEHSGKTLGYELIEMMLNKNRIRDMIFFTGTPHRGKNFGFLSLMHLLEPEFNPKLTQFEQLDILRKYMIRNNKYTITDLNGERLFIKPEVTSKTYQYSPEEAAFYNKLTAFIRDGFLYADRQTLTVGRSVSLVLICMQKLASSSVAAIRNTIFRRLAREESGMREAEQMWKAYEDYLSCNRSALNEDEISLMDYQIVAKATELKLIENEKPALQELLSLADKVVEETKIKTILEDVATNFCGEQVLFFTEYKATQRLLLECLMRKYGRDSVTFINGDSSLDNIHFPDDSLGTMAADRHVSARKFNEGKVRFLIATEAAGEGIDLQKKCHVMFHVDLPWNPMRLHQRVGRLNRYGQKKKVIVHSFRNPDTVESRIWEKLNRKIEAINQAFGAVMEEHEDMFMLVLGMTNPGLFNNLFGYAPKNASPDSLSAWFDQATAQFGSKDVVEVVKELVGNTSRFDYKETSRILPQVDLPDLRRFLQNILEYNDHKRLMAKDGVYRFNTPDKWLEDFKIEENYSNVVFSRYDKGEKTIAGIGNAAFNQGMFQALQINAQTAWVQNLENPLLIYAARERHTDSESEMLLCYYGAKLDLSGKVIAVLTDWELLQELNKIPFSSITAALATYEVPAPLLATLKEAESKVVYEIMQLIFQEVYHPENPVLNLEGIFLPVCN